MACHVAGGMPWLGRRVHQGAVLYVAAERAKLTERRFAAFRKHHQLHDLPLAVIAGAVDFLSDRRHVDEIVGHAKTLVEITGEQIVLIVVDTVSRVLNGGDENSPKDMGALVANVAALQEATGAHVLLIHHIPQDGNVRLRGHGALLGSLDTVVAIEKIGLIRTATVIKDNDGVENCRLAFDLKSVSLSIDPDTGRETTAPIVVPAPDSASRSVAKNVKLPKGAQIALRALQSRIEECGSIPPASNHIPPNTKTVSIEQWRTHSYKIGISTSDKANAKRTALSRASDVLLAARKIEIWESHVCVCGMSPEHTQGTHTTTGLKAFVVFCVAIPRHRKPLCGVLYLLWLIWPTNGVMTLKRHCRKVSLRFFCRCPACLARSNCWCQIRDLISPRGACSSTARCCRGSVAARLDGLILPLAIPAGFVAPTPAPS